MKKLPLIIIIIILLIVFIGIWLFVGNIKNASKQSTKTMKQIRNDYTSLEEVISEYNDTREELINNLSSSYTKTLAENYGQTTNLLMSIENSLTEAEELTKKLDKNCQKQLYTETTVNNICKSYQEYYEQLANLYINDINKFNDRILIYNNSKEEKLEEYTSNLIKDYIDYNQDGKYSEREE